MTTTTKRSRAHLYQATADRIIELHSGTGHTSAVAYLAAERAAGTPWAKILSDCWTWGLALSEQTAANWLQGGQP